MEEKRGGFFGLFGRRPKPQENTVQPVEENLPDEEIIEEWDPASEDIVQDIAEDVTEDAAADVAENTAEPSAPPPPPEKKGIFARFKEKLLATHNAIFSRVEETFLRTRKVDEDLFDNLEEILITADVGVETTMRLIQDLRDAARRERREKRDSIEWLKGQIETELKRVIGEKKTPVNIQPEGTTVILIVGVNGVGKTTAIGKLSHRYRQQGKKVLMVAADTFRAAAIDQLGMWAERAGVDIIKGQEGADPGSVVYDAMQAARSRKSDVVIIDTAGRLHTKTNLMAELQKIGKIISREFPGAPHETLLVIDASTGHNGLQQAKIFAEAVPLTGIVLTKLDGTAKGGVTIAVHAELSLPVKLVGLGEGIEDLDDFDPAAFISAVLN